MQKVFIHKNINYTGEQLVSHWILKSTGSHGDTIASFLGQANVWDHMVDQEDIIRNAPIHSENMLHFIIEHFDSTLEITILRQRILMSIIKEVISSEYNLRVDRLGDDLFVSNRKLSVSIATISPVSGLIHCGLNISNKNTPVPTYALDEFISVKEIPVFAENIMEVYVNEIKSMENAKCKVKSVS